MYIQVETQAILCNMTQAQWQELSDALNEYVNTTSIVEQVGGHMPGAKASIDIPERKDPWINMDETLIQHDNVGLMSD